MSVFVYLYMKECVQQMVVKQCVVFTEVTHVGGRGRKISPSVRNLSRNDFCIFFHLPAENDDIIKPRHKVCEFYIVNKKLK